MRLQYCKLKQESHRRGPFLNVICEFWLAPGVRELGSRKGRWYVLGALSACRDSAFRAYAHVSLCPLLLSLTSVKLALRL